MNMTDRSREFALIERARWVGLRLEINCAASTIRTYQVVEPVTGMSLTHPEASGALDLDHAEALIDLHSSPE